MNQRIKKQTNERTKDRILERTNRRTDKRLIMPNGSKNEWMGFIIQWGFRLHNYVHISYTWSGELEDGEINEMTLPCGQRIRNLSPGGPSTSTIPLGQGGSPWYWIVTSERGRIIPECESEGRNPRSLIWHRVWSAKLSLNDTKSEIRSMQPHNFML